MRTFVAIELSDQIKTYLNKIQNQLRTSGADIKWVEPENIHLTLKFLGEIDDKKLAKVVEILKATAADGFEFYLRLASLGAFPNLNSPRVIWVGLDQGDKETKEIAETLEDKLAEIGIPEENRSFSSHITIGRSRSGLNRIKLTPLLKDLSNIPGEENLRFKVTKITLYKSTLTPKGPVYEALKEVSLKTN